MHIVLLVEGHFENDVSYICSKTIMVNYTKERSSWLMEFSVKLANKATGILLLLATLTYVTAINL